MTRLLAVLVLLAGVFVGLVFAAQVGWNRGPVVITREDEQKIVLFLGEARRVTEPGLGWILPLVQNTETYDRRWLYLNTEPDTIQTRDGEQLIIDNYAIWRIADAIQFKRSFPNMRDAEQRIDRAVRDDVREVLGRHRLIEVLKDRRTEIVEEIAEKTRSTLQEFGIEVADVRINRTELPEQTTGSVYARMTTERERLAKKNRAEGDERARRVRAEADREARVIVAEARRDSEILRGKGDAEAAHIYAEAYGQDPEFYTFVRSLEAYRKTIDGRTTLVLSPQAEFFQFFDSSRAPGAGDGAP